MWREEPNPQNIGTGVFVGKHVYVPDAGPGTLRCIEPETGKVVWQERMPGGGRVGLDRVRRRARLRDLPERRHRRFRTACRRIQDVGC